MRLSTIAVLSLATAAFAAPVSKRWDGGDAYTGVGGSAKGGNAATGSGNRGGLGGLSVLPIASGNGGDGGRCLISAKSMIS